METTRTFKIGGHVFSIILENPWKVMDYTPAVLQRIAQASEGKEIPVEPVRAGDEVPPRTFVRFREELPVDMDGNTLDLSEYEPFAYEGQEKSLFRLRIRPRSAYPSVSMAGRKDSRLIVRFDSDLPYYSIYSLPDKIVFEFEPVPGRTAGLLFLSEDFTLGEYYPHPDAGSYLTLAQICSSCMAMFSATTSSMQTIMMHASVVRLDGKAYVFLGASGTGKSTHSRLWLENIPGCDLVNDDNPALWFAPDGKLYVSGTPWSGKTPCYRNLDVEVGAFVRLEQAPENRIRRLEGLEAYIGILPSCSSMKWVREVDKKISKTIEKMALEIPCWHLDCLPDPDAARTCMEAVSTK